MEAQQRQLRHHFSRLVLIVTFGALVALATASAASTANLGVYRGAAAPAAVDSYGSWLGRDAVTAIEFFARDDWTDIHSPIWWLQAWQGSPYELSFAVAMLPESGSYTLAQGAVGAYDSYFVTLAQNLVAHGHGDAVIRLGWEFNGSWYAWAGQADPTSFVTYWRRIVDAMRSVPGTGFRFDWNPILGGATVDHLYPGDAYVDIIGLDVYDQIWYPSWQDPAARWQAMLYQPAGLVWHRDFARAHEKPMSFPEWGLVSVNGSAGGGDNPYFIEKMYEWIGQNIDSVGYYAYFEYPGTIGNHRLMTGEFPSSAAKFRELFATEPPALPNDPPLPGPPPPEDPPAGDPPPAGNGDGEQPSLVGTPEDAGDTVIRVFGAHDGGSVKKRPKLAVYVDGTDDVDFVAFHLNGELVCADQTEPYRCRPTLDPGWHDIDVVALSSTGKDVSLSLRVQFEPKRKRVVATDGVDLPKVAHRRDSGVTLDVAFLDALS